MQTYTGGCHCGAVRYEVQADLGQVIECNCSHCSAKGLLLTFVPREQFTLLSGEDQLSEYRFNRKTIGHQFCKICGVQSFSYGQRKDGTPTVAINVRCLDGVDIKELTLTPVNGKDF